MVNADVDKLKKWYHQHIKDGKVTDYKDIQRALEHSFPHDARPSGVNEEESKEGLKHLHKKFGEKISQDDFANGLHAWAKNHLK